MDIIEKRYIFDKDKKYDFFNTLHFVITKPLFFINKKCIESLRFHNPTIEIIIHTHDPKILEEEFISKNNLKINEFIMFGENKIDIIRFYVLYLYGGINLDLDMICFKNLEFYFDTLRGSPTKIICCKEDWKNGDYGINDGMLIASPGNDVIKKIILSNSKNYCKELKKYDKSDLMLLLESYNFNPIPYFFADKILNNPRWFPKLENCYCVNLFAKSSYKVLNNFENIPNSLLNTIIRIGIGEMDIKDKKLDFKNISLVISRFRESSAEVRGIVNKFKKYNPKIFIYNKGIEDLDIEENKNIKIKSIPNLGREGQTWLHHILENYEEISDLVYFIPASVENKKGLNSYKNVFGCLEKYTLVQNNLGKIDYNFTLDKWDGTHKQNSEIVKTQTFTISKIRPYGLWFEENISKPLGGKKYMEWSNQGCGGIIQATKFQIKKIPKELIEKWNSEMSEGPNPEVGHYWERSWASIFI